MVSIITSIYTCSIDGIALFIQKTVSTRYATIFSVFPPITFCKKSMIQLLFHLKHHIYNIRQTIIILIKPKTKKKNQLPGKMDVTCWACNYDCFTLCTVYCLIPRFTSLYTYTGYMITCCFIKAMSTTDAAVFSIVTSRTF